MDIENIPVITSVTYKPKPIDREYISGLLKTAADVLNHHQDGSHDDSAAWRLADAAFLFLRLIEAEGKTDIPGIHEQTGRGAMLPIDRQR